VIEGVRLGVAVGVSEGVADGTWFSYIPNLRLCIVIY
jgi:hypothetical protein